MVTSIIPTSANMFLSIARMSLRWLYMVMLFLLQLHCNSTFVTIVILSTKISTIKNFQISYIFNENCTFAILNQKVAGSIPVWGSEIFSEFAKAWVAKKFSFNLPSCKSLDIYLILNLVTSPTLVPSEQNISDSLAVDTCTSGVLNFVSALAQIYCYGVVCLWVPWVNFFVNWVSQSETETTTYDC